MGTTDRALWFAIGATVLSLSLFGCAGTVATSESLGRAQDTAIGPVLVAPDGRTLYTYDKDGKGDARAGIETGQQALALAEQAANPLEQGAAHRALAQAHEADDDDAAARAQFHNSLAILGKIQSPPELAQSLLAYGRFQLKTNAEDSREHLERALAIFEKLGATGWIEETRAALASA